MKIIMTAMALMLGMSAGCAVESIDEADQPEATATETQGLGAGCPLKRRYGWTKNGVPCAGESGPDLWLLDGQIYETDSVGDSPFGIGHAEVQCVNGALERLVWTETCRRGIGSPL